jgi:hypothetical protein
MFDNFKSVSNSVLKSNESYFKMSSFAFALPTHLPPPTDREEIAIVLVLLDQKRRIRGATL